MENKATPQQFNFVLWLLEVCWVLFILSVMTPFVLLGFILTGSFQLGAGMFGAVRKVHDFVNERR